MIASPFFVLKISSGEREGADSLAPVGRKADETRFIRAMPAP